MIEALEFPISLLVWTIICWATIPVITAFNNDQDNIYANVTGSSVHWVRILQKVFLASIPVSGLFLAEKVVIELITVNYHRTQFAAKISESKHRTYLFELLYEASAVLYPPYCEKFAGEDATINPTLISTVGKNIVEAAALNPASPLRVFDDLGRLGNGAVSVFGNIVSEATGIQRQDTTSPHFVVTWALEQKESSEALARRVFKSLVAEGNDALYQSDIEKVLGRENEREVEEIFNALDKDNNGDVSLAEMTMMVIELGNDRRATASSLHDVDRAIKALDRILLCVVIVGSALIYGKASSE
jgi:hypothetical protein